MSHSIDPTRVTTSAEFSLHTKANHDGVNEYVYLQASGAIESGDVCIIDRGGQAVPVTTSLVPSNDGSGLGVAQQAVADNSYAWFQVYGPCATIRTNASVTEGGGLHTTSSTGRVDDADSTGNIHGIRIEARTGAGTTAGILMYPTVSTE